MQWTDNNPPLQHNAFWSYNFSHLPFWKHTENILARLFVPYMSFSDVLYFPHKTVFSRKNHVLTIVLSYVCVSLDFLVQSCIIAAWITRLNQTELKPPFIQPNVLFVLVSCIRVIIMDPLRVVYWFPTRATWCIVLFSFLEQCHLNVCNIITFCLGCIIMIQ